jgi:hypothetical protein
MKHFIIFASLVAVVMLGLAHANVCETPSHCLSGFSSVAGPLAAHAATADASASRRLVILSARGAQITTLRGRAGEALPTFDDDPIAEGTVLVECDHAVVAPSAPSNAVGQVECTGNVVIRGGTFTAQADRLVSSGDQIVFTGDGKPVHFSGQPSRDVKLLVAMDASRVVIDLTAHRPAIIEP